MITNRPRKTEKFDARCDLPGLSICDFILLPYGYMYNREFDNARHGDTLMFGDVQKTILSVQRLKMDKACDCLCRMRYGIHLDELISRWRHESVLFGGGIHAVSTEVCLIVFFRSYRGNEKSEQ